MPRPSQPADLLPPEDAADLDEFEEVEVIYDDSDTADTEEETTEALEEDVEDDDDPALALDEDDAESDESDEITAIRTRMAELEADLRRAKSGEENSRNQAYWDDIEQQAITAFEYDEGRIWADKDNYIDPDGYVRVETAKLLARVASWYRKFYASQNDSREKQREQQTIPIYASQVAQHFGLSAEGAKELLSYAPFLSQDPNIMVREAQRIAKSEAKERVRTKSAQQSQRKQVRQSMAPVNSGSGRAPARKVKAGSMSHLRALLSSQASV
jgi:hypothetical protein